MDNNKPILAYNFIMENAELQYINRGRIEIHEVERLAIEFAKIKVEEALNAVIHNNTNSGYNGISNEEILDSYQLDKIE